MLHSSRKIVLALVGSALVSLLSLAPAAAQSAYPGGSKGMGYGNSYGMQQYGNSYGMQRGNSYGMQQYDNKSYGMQGYDNKSYGMQQKNYDNAKRVKVVLYKIKFGDTLNRIAARFGTSVFAILRLNPRIKNPDLIFAGQFLRVPMGGRNVYGSSYGPANDYGNY